MGQALYLVRAPAAVRADRFRDSLPGKASPFLLPCFGATYIFLDATPAEAADAFLLGSPLVFPVPAILKQDPLLHYAEHLDLFPTSEREGVSRRRFVLTPSASEEPGAVAHAWLGMLADLRNPANVSISVGSGLGNSTRETLAFIELEVPVDAIGELSFFAFQPEALYIEPIMLLTTSNIDAAYITQSGTMRWGSNRVDDSEANAPLWYKGINGTGQIVGIGDTGLDMQSCYFRDPEFNEAANKVVRRKKRDVKYKSHRKVIRYVGWVDGDAAENSGHGTHVAGSVAGSIADTEIDGTNGDGAHKGVAFGAKIVFHDLAEGNSSSVRAPSDLYDLFVPTYESGGRIHTNSWNSRNQGYDGRCVAVDRFMYEHQDFLALNSAGNFGMGTGATGTVGSPANAKGVLTVGASLNADATFSSGCRSDRKSRQSCPENLAYFSSNGPTPDGRIKPEVVAPGLYVRSARSFANPHDSCSTTIKAGTSMATPITAGNALLVRQYFVDGFYPSGAARQEDGFNPMGALVKAVLVNGAQALQGYYDSFDLAMEGQGPSRHQGFGLTQLSFNLPLDGVSPGQNLFVVGDAGEMSVFTEPGELKEYVFYVDGSRDFRVTLVWTDPPATFGAAAPLVNDLDLQVASADGALLFPNGLSGPDRVNTVEHIQLSKEDLVSGKFTVTVRAARLNQDQPFALVASGAFSLTPPEAGNPPSPDAPESGPPPAPSVPVPSPIESPPEPGCSSARILFAIDESVGYKNSAIGEQTMVVSDLVDAVNFGALASQASIVHFGREVKSVIPVPALGTPASHNSSAVRKALLQSIQNATANGGASDFTALFSADLAGRLATGSSNPSIIIMSDSRPWAQSRSKKSALKSACSAAHSFKKLHGAAKIVCLQSSDQAQSNGFYRCACDAIYTARSRRGNSRPSVQAVIADLHDLVCTEVEPASDPCAQVMSDPNFPGGKRGAAKRKAACRAVRLDSMGQLPPPDSALDRPVSTHCAWSRNSCALLDRFASLYA